MLKFLIIVFFSMNAYFPIVVAQENKAKEWLYFVGLQDGHWYVFAKIVHDKFDDSTFQIIKTQSEAREIYFQANKKTLIYLDAAAQLRSFSLENEKEEILLSSNPKASYAQPFVDKKGRIYLVQMPAGESSKADIVMWYKTKLYPSVRQLSSQFEPFVNDKWLYFGHVHCTIDCGRIIQEIWRKNTISGESEQLTLMGHIARQAIVDQQNQYLYFSSNRAGHYHIWRQRLPHSKPEQLTQGNTSDTDPALDKLANLYFIRHQAGKVYLMQKTVDGLLKTLTLPKNIKEIRNLRVNY